MQSIFHIALHSAWRDALTVGTYSADTLTSEGFIHCSTESQVEGTLQRYFAGRKDLVLLQIHTAPLGAALVFEPAHGELYPHLYAPLPLSAVTAVYQLVPTSDGSFARVPFTTSS